MSLRKENNSLDQTLLDVMFISNLDTIQGVIGKGLYFRLEEVKTNSATLLENVWEKRKSLQTTNWTIQVKKQKQSNNIASLGHKFCPYFSLFDAHYLFIFSSNFLLFSIWFLGRLITSP